MNRNWDFRSSFFSVECLKPRLFRLRRGFLGRSPAETRSGNIVTVKAALREQAIERKNTPSKLFLDYKCFNLKL